MNRTPLVSIITIFLDAAPFFEEAIASIFDQRYTHWELLLVDDGSTDGSTDLARKLAKRDPDRVRYLEHPYHQNRGMSASRNLALQNAGGEYIAFLDADDVWLPNKLDEQIQIMIEHQRAAMVYGRTEIWRSWTNDPDDADYMIDLGVPPNSLVEPPDLLTLLLENNVQTPTTCSALVRRRICDQVGGFKDDFRAMFEDQAFFFKVCLEEPVYVSGTCWARYRQHADSCCAVAQRLGGRHISRQPLLRWLDGYLKERDADHPEVRAALRRELWPYEHPILNRLSMRVRAVRRRIRVGRRYDTRTLERRSVSR